MGPSELIINKFLILLLITWPCDAVYNPAAARNQHQEETKETVDLTPESAQSSWTAYARRLARMERSFKCCLLGRTAAKIGYVCDLDLQAIYLQVNKDHFHSLKTEVWMRTPPMKTGRVLRQCRKHRQRYLKCCKNESEYIDQFIKQKRRELRRPSTTAPPTTPTMHTVSIAEIDPLEDTQ